MKTRKIVIAGLALAMSVAACSQTPTLPDGTSAKSLLPTKAQVDSTSYLLGVNFGSFIKSYNFGEDLNYSQIEQGIKDFVNAKGDQNAPEFLDQFKISPELMNDVFNSYLEKMSAYSAAVADVEAQKFFTENLKTAGVHETESGLQYIIVEPGNDNHPGPASQVSVRYKGALTDGTVFDEVEEGAEPIVLGLDRVIPGWTEGIQLIGEGGKIKLFIPSRLGYGERGAGSIAPNSTLIFDVELVEVIPSEEVAE